MTLIVSMIKMNVVRIGQRWMKRCRGIDPRIRPCAPFGSMFPNEISLPRSCEMVFDGGGDIDDD